MSMICPELLLTTPMPPGEPTEVLSSAMNVYLPLADSDWLAADAVAREGHDADLKRLRVHQRHLRNRAQADDEGLPVVRHLHRVRLDADERVAGQRGCASRDVEDLRSVVVPDGDVGGLAVRRDEHLARAIADRKLPEQLAGPGVELRDGVRDLVRRVEIPAVPRDPDGVRLRERVVARRPVGDPLVGGRVDDADGVRVAGRSRSAAAGSASGSSRG
jgi:hypothetical protein